MDLCSHKNDFGISGELQQAIANLTVTTLVEQFNDMQTSKASEGL